MVARWFPTTLFPPQVKIVKSALTPGFVNPGLRVEISRLKAEPRGKHCRGNCTGLLSPWTFSVLRPASVMWDFLVQAVTDPGVGE